MTATPETTIIFRRTGGHTHDGLTSSLLDTTKYSMFDFSPVSIGSAGTARRRFQDNNKILIKKFIVDTIEERVLNPQGIEIQANTITARHITAGTITADELSSNLVLVNNIIRSNAFNGTFYSNGSIANTGTVGWAIANSGVAVFNDVTIRGNITGGSSININNVFTVNSSGTVSATSGTIGGWTLSTTSLTAGSTSLHSNGHIVVASGTFNGAIGATSGNIGGWNIESNRLHAGSTSLHSNGHLSVASGSFTGSINTGSSVTVGDFSAPGNSVGMRLTSDGFIQGSGGGVRIKDYGGTTGTILFGGSIYTPNLLADDMSVSNGTNSVTIDPDSFWMMDLEFSRTDANDAAIRINRSGLNNMSRHMIFAKLDGTHVGAIRYKNNDNNTIVFTGDITGTSDFRLKENIKPLENSLEVVNKINAVSFNFKRSPDINDHGFIAQELYSILPVAVEPGGDDPESQPWGVMYTKLIPISISAIQELSNKINQLEHRLQILEGV